MFISCYIWRTLCDTLGLFRCTQLSLPKTPMVGSVTSLTVHRNPDKQVLKLWKNLMVITILIHVDSERHLLKDKSTEIVLHEGQEADTATDFLRRTLNTRTQVHDPCKYSLWHRLTYTFWCRYKKTGDVGNGHKVLGKLMNCSVLSAS